MKSFYGNGAAKTAWLRWSILASAMAFSGCSTTTVVRRGQDLHLNEAGILIKKDGKGLEVRNAIIRDDSIFVIDSRLDRKIRMPAIEAEKLVVKERLQGAWQGMLFFAGAGAVLGAIPDPGCGDPCLFPNGGLGGSIFWAALAAPVGAVWGFILGSHRNYVFERPAPVPDPVGDKDGKQGL